MELCISHCAPAGSQAWNLHEECLQRLLIITRSKLKIAYFLHPIGGCRRNNSTLERANFHVKISMRSEAMS